MRGLIIGISLFISHLSYGQELFVYSEPASNMSSKSIGLRLKNESLLRSSSNEITNMFQPEVMWGVNRYLMLHADVFFSNRSGAFKEEGMSLYMKYRFFSRDDIHSHFRMALFVKGAINKGPINDRAINLSGDNSGIETGVIATALTNKVAFSSNLSFLHAANNSSGHKFPFDDKRKNALGGILSIGKLMLPKEYTNYKQVNLNAMVELLSQWNPSAGETYLDLAPSIQFIFLSKMRLDVGYRFPLYDGMDRVTPKGALLRIEYNFFNAY